jgi:hypothetical protein
MRLTGRTIDIIERPPSGIHADDGSAALVFIQLQGFFGRQDQRLQHARKYRLAIKEAIHHDFPVQACQHPAQLSTAPVALRGLVAFGRKAGFGSAGEATHIHIKDLKAGLVVMLKAPTVLPIDRIDGLFHLLHILCRTSIQGVLSHRLLGTAATSEGMLQADIGEPPRIDLDESVRSGRHADPGIVQFVAGPILDRLLGNLHVVLNGLKELAFSQFQTQGCQTGAAR